MLPIDGTMSVSEDFIFEYKPDYLLVRASGRSAIDQKEASVLAIAAAIRAGPVKGALVDLRDVVKPYTFMDRYQLGELAGRHLTEVPIAVLAVPAQVDPQYIGKLVAVNRGAKVDVFTDEAKAVAWLKQQMEIGRPPITPSG
jgi:hypothetical protein